MKISVFLVSLLMVVLVMVGCTFGTDEVSEDRALFLDQVKNILEAEGLELGEIEGDSPVEEEIPVAPKAYRINEDHGKVFIYEFETISERMESFPFTIRGEMVEISEEDIYFPLGAKNIAIIYQPGDTESGPFIEESTKLNNAVFYQMHGIEEKSFQGRGDHWDISLEIKYFEYQWMDREGQQNTEFYGYSSFDLKYLDTNPEEVSELSFQFSFNDQASRELSTKATDGSSVLEESGSYKVLRNTLSEPVEKEVIPTRVSWMDNEEEIDLTGKK